MNSFQAQKIVTKKQQTNIKKSSLHRKTIQMA